MDDQRRQLLILIILRLVLVSLVTVAALSAAPQFFPASPFLRLYVLAVYVLSGLYLLFWRYTDRPDELYKLQFIFDLLLLSLLIYLSRGVDSPFTPFYVLIIVYASLMRDRKGAILAVTLSLISYSGIVHLGYLNWLPTSAETLPYPETIYRILWNALGFVAVGLLGTYLSERWQRTRRELGAIKFLHDNIVNSIRTGLMTLDPEGRITSLNRAAEEICSRPPQDLLAEPVSKIFPPGIQSTILGSDFQSSARPLRAECWVERQDRTFVFLGMSCSPLLSETGEKIGFIISFQDLTEIKKREEELQVKEKMATIGQVAAGLAHEIRNPLGALSGSIQILRSELDLSGERGRLIEIVLRECDRLNKIVGDFLTYAGPRPLVLQPVDLAPLVRDTVALFKNHPEFNSHHLIHISSPPEIPCVVDPDQLRQAIWNVLQNGVRAMPEGGRLLVKLSRGDTRVSLRFRDEGVGMTADEKRKLFQPFHSGFKKGAGLGMAIVYQIVQQHHGHIEVDTSPGQGTVIRISLPARGVSS